MSDDLILGPEARRGPRSLGPDPAGGGSRWRAPRFSSSSSPDFTEERCRAADVRILALDRRMGLQEQAVELTRCAVAAYQWDARTLVEGAAADDAAIVMLIVNNDSEALFSGEVVSSGDVLIFGPGATHLVHGGRRGTISLFLPADELQKQLNSLLATQAPDIRGRRFRIRLPLHHAARLHAALRRPWMTLRADHVGPPSADAWNLWESEYLGAVCDIVSRAWSPRKMPESLARREAILSSSMDLIASSGGRIDLTGLCEETGYSAETLRLVFREFLGITPMRFVKAHRLHACRRALRQADPSLDNVKSVAWRAGITGNLGRFAKAYRATFGELPSETLRAATGDESTD